MVLYNLYVKVAVSYALGKSKTPQIAVYPGIPSPWFLLKPLQSFLELTHMGLPPMQLKSFRLLDVDFFLNLPIEESSLYIHLMKLLPMTEAKEIMTLIELYLATGAKVSS